MSMIQGTTINTKTSTNLQGTDPLFEVSEKEMNFSELFMSLVSGKNLTPLVSFLGEPEADNNLQSLLSQLAELLNGEMSPSPLAGENVQFNLLLKNIELFVNQATQDDWGKLDDLISQILQVMNLISENQAEIESPAGQFTMNQLLAKQNTMLIPTNQSIVDKYPLMDGALNRGVSGQSSFLTGGGSPKEFQDMIVKLMILEKELQKAPLLQIPNGLPDQLKTLLEKMTKSLENQGNQFQPTFGKWSIQQPMKSTIQNQIVLPENGLVGNEGQKEGKNTTKISSLQLENPFALQSPINQKLMNQILVPNKMVINSQQFAKEMENFMIKDMKIFKLNGFSEAKISLHPEELGQVNVKIITKNGQLITQFYTETTQGRDLIENNLFQLRMALSQQGIQVDRMEVKQDMSLFQQGEVGGGFQQSQQFQQFKQSPDQHHGKLPRYYDETDDGSNSFSLAFNQYSYSGINLTV
ncbi:flagellar hook-length control protein FliK [Microaerobacter geothermalis]|uniref:flagellar hook-length control protein FliK n=1 Tax=Microaerobacter geothermalis TaxID=674972 RepID=UPI001F41B19A|nr:flagellar hook-length control protein FliK [Microaerobacter geothermalis]MCF6093834.1 flagellar hook-length control protein FliK [Microaerobacter geothermalis]